MQTKKIKIKVIFSRFSYKRDFLIQNIDKIIKINYDVFVFNS